MSEKNKQGESSSRDRLSISHTTPQESGTLDNNNDDNNNKEHRTWCESTFVTNLPNNNENKGDGLEQVDTSNQTTPNSSFPFSFNFGNNSSNTNAASSMPGSNLDPNSIINMLASMHPFSTSQPPIVSSINNNTFTFPPIGPSVTNSTSNTYYIRYPGANSSAFNNNIPNIGTGTSSTNTNNTDGVSSLGTSNPPNTGRTNTTNVSPQFLYKYLGRMAMTQKGHYNNFSPCWF